MCSLVRYHEHLFCQFPFTKCLYFLNPSCISASAFIHLLCYCIKYQTYQNICMNQLFPSTRITTLSASQDTCFSGYIYDWSMTGSAYFSWEECLAMDTLSELISIFIRKIFPLRIIISERNHPHSEESASRDYFFQGEFIPIQKNLLPRIIFPKWIHPHSEESSSKDYFPKVNSSPFERIFFQGLFSPDKIIPIRKNPPPGIIFPGWIHLCSEESVSRDALGI